MTLNADEGLATSRGISVEQVQTLRRTRGLTSAGIESIPAPALARALRRLEYPDLPRARDLYRRLQARDENGQVPARAMLDAVRQLDSLRVRRTAQASVAGVPTGASVAPERLGLMLEPTAGLDRPDWVPLGPGNIGGRARAIVFHPPRHDTIWAASAGGGVWRTVDAGTTWCPVDDLMANLAVTTLALDH